MNLHDYDFIPKRFINSLLRYSEHRIETGSFLRAVLENDLHGAISYGDGEALFSLGAIVNYVHKELPEACSGSKEKVAKWLSQPLASPKEIA